MESAENPQTQTQTQIQIQDLWYFWNHSYYGRVYPTRQIRYGYLHLVSPKKYTVICSSCGKETPLNRSKIKGAVLNHPRNKNPTNVKQRGYLCDSCYEERLKALRTDRNQKNLDMIAAFDTIMVDCAYNTCDILAAHHELLKDDPERLTTEFLLGLIGNAKHQKAYLKRKNNADS